MTKSPLTIVKERFGDDRKAAKSKLVKAVKDAAGKDLWLDRLNEEQGLEQVSNRKLLHLESVFAEVSKAVGSRKKLIEAIAEAHGKKSDADYKSALEGRPTPRLWDQYKALQKRSAKKA